jgi:hypothetical protein
MANQPIETLALGWRRGKMAALRRQRLFSATVVSIAAVGVLRPRVVSAEIGRRTSRPFLECLSEAD